MRSILFAAAMALTLPSLAQAEDASQAETPKPPKVKKVCRYTPPPTGSNRPGLRRCRTIEEWQVEDRQTGDVAMGTNGAPARSQPQDNN